MLWPLPLSCGLLPLVPEDSGKACVGGWAGSFALAGFEEVVQVVVVVLVEEEMVVLWRGFCEQRWGIL